MHSTSVKSPQPKQSSLLGDYLRFLKTPTYHTQQAKPRQILHQIWRLYTLHIVLIIPMTGLIHLLSRWIVSIEENKLGDLVQTLAPYQFLLMAVVVAPLSEELLFRLPLKFEFLNFAIPLGLLLFVLGGQMVALASPPWLGFIGWMGAIGLGFIALRLIFRRISQTRGERFFAHHLRKLVYGSAILFGFVHIMNYPSQAWWVGPILVLPQTTLGVLLAYVRIRFGFIWAIVTHALHNFLASSPILFMALGSEKLQQQLINPDQAGELLPQDYVIQGLLFVWVLGLSTWILKTMVQLIQEWRTARQNTINP